MRTRPRWNSPRSSSGSSARPLTATGRVSPPVTAPPSGPWSPTRSSVATAPPSLAVRQYVTAYYDELFAADRKRQPQAVNLLQKFGGDRQPLGGKLRKAKDQSDPDVRASFSLCSYQWLTGRIAEALNEIGKGSHTLCLPPPKEAGIVGKHLAAHHPDGQGWEEAGLLRPPVVPASTVLVVWLAGTAVPSGAVPLSVQLTEQELPAPVRAHVGTPRASAQSSSG